MQDDLMKLEELSIDDLIRVAEQDMIMAPHYLREDTMLRSQSIQVQLPMKIEVHTKQISKKMQMFCYTMKISAAMICALILLLIVPNINMNIEHSYQRIEEPFETQKSEMRSTFMEKRSDFRESIDEIKENIIETINGGNEHE